MHPQSHRLPVGDQYETEVLEVFGEEYSAEIYVAIYEIYDLDFPPDVAQWLIAFEQRMREEPAVDPYADYLTDYYSTLAEDLRE